MSRQTATDGGQARPDWRVNALRCGLEVALVALIAAYLWVNVDSSLLRGVIAVLGLVGSVGILFYYVNEQSLAWVRYASAQSRQRSKRRKRERRKQRQEEAENGRERDEREREQRRKRRQQRRQTQQRRQGDNE